MAKQAKATGRVVRAFELPVQRIEPVGDRDGWELVRECWREATSLANWGVQQLLRADVVRTPGMSRLPGMPDVDLYALAFGRKAPKARRKGARREDPLPAVEAQYDGSFFAGAAISASTILTEIRKKYIADRLEVIWRGSQAPCTYRYPHPWPVHAQGWKGAGFDPEGNPWVLCTLPGGLVKITLRGRTGTRDAAEFGRQLALFRQVVKGDLPRKQLVIRQQGSSSGCHRPTVEDGGRPCRVMVKMVAELPIRERPGNRTLVLLTDPAAFWVAELDGRRAWILNADHVRRLVLHDEHLRWLQRVSEDGKAERRMGSNRHQKVQQRLERASEKDRNRLASWTHESAAHLAGFCQRQRVGNVLYLDRDQGFCPRFPWFELRQKLAQKLEMAGIGFYTESGVEQPSPADTADGSGGGFGIDIRPTTSEEDERWGRTTRLREWAADRLLAARSRTESHPAVSAP